MLKCDMLFRQQTNKSGSTQNPVRVGGWSEGWYLADNAVDPFGKLNQLCTFRARLLTDAAAIIGQRIRKVGGSASTAGRVFIGALSVRADIPQMALLATIRGVNVNNVRRFVLRGMPDSVVEEGEFTNFSTTNRNLLGYDHALSDLGFCFHGRKLDALTVGVESISDAGVVTPSTLFPVSAGMRFRTLRVTSTVTGNVISVVRTVVAFTSTTFTLGNWTFGAATGGKLRQEDEVFPACLRDSLAKNRVVTHKVGKDFFQYHGRRSNRR